MSAMTPVARTDAAYAVRPPANASRTTMVSASWADTNMSRAMAPTPSATSPTLSAIPAANWRESPPSARRRAANAWAPITAGAPKASISPAVMAASRGP